MTGNYPYILPLFNVAFFFPFFFFFFFLAGVELIIAFMFCFYHFFFGHCFHFFFLNKRFFNLSIVHSLNQTHGKKKLNIFYPLTFPLRPHFLPFHFFYFHFLPSLSTQVFVNGVLFGSKLLSTVYYLV